MIDKEVDQDGNVMVTVKGSMRDANDAKRNILDLVSSNSNWNSDRSGGGGGGGGGRNFDRGDNSRNYDSRSDSSRNFERRNDSSRNNDSRSNDHKDTLEIYPDKVGSVIGRGGSTIKDIQERFKVRVNIDKNTNYNGKSTVTVSGSQSDVANAIGHIRELVGEPNLSESQQNGYGSQSQSQQQQNNRAPEPMEFEVIDWQAAARESEEANRRRWAALPPLQKFFYEEHPEVTNMTPERVEEIRQQNNNITVSRLFLDENGANDAAAPIPNPIEKFEQCFAKYPDLMGNFRYSI